MLTCASIHPLGLTIRDCSSYGCGGPDDRTTTSSFLIPVNPEAIGRNFSVLSHHCVPKPRLQIRVGVTVDFRVAGVGVRGAMLKLSLRSSAESGEGHIINAL